METSEGSLADLSEEIDASIKKVRPRNLRELLYLWKILFEDKDLWSVDQKKKKMVYSTKKLQNWLKQVETFKIKDWVFTSKISTRRARDFKYALETLLLIDEYQKKVYKKQIVELTNTTAKTE